MEIKDLFKELLAICVLVPLLHNFCCADTVWNFSSSSTIYSESIEDSNSVYVWWFSSSYWHQEDIYFCISSQDFPFYYEYNYSQDYILVDSSVYCSDYTIWISDEDMYFYNDSHWDSDKYINWTIYYSTSPITYSSWPSVLTVNDLIPWHLLYTWTKTATTSFSNVFNYWNNGSWTYCVKFTSSNPLKVYLWFANGWTTSPSNQYTLREDQYNNWICLYWNKSYFNVKTDSSTTTYSYEIFKLTDLLNTEIDINYCTWNNLCPAASCKTGYTIIRRDMTDANNRPSITYDINSVDTIYLKYYPSEGHYSVWDLNLSSYGWRVNEDNRIKKSYINTGYCTWHNLCPVVSCDYSEYESQINSLSWSLNSCQNTLWASSSSLSSCQNSLNSCLSANCPSVWVSWSSLFINDIQHLGASNIYMSIPEEISRDYSYSNSWEIMEIDVEWYNVDYDYINNVVDIQKYKPSDEDFNNIIWILAQYMPIIVIFIGLLFLYKLLKKPFKSKL